MILQHFHPLIAEWFQSRFPEPTPPQTEGWPHIHAGRNILIAAPTGSGKTLTAFLSAIDHLLRLALAGDLTAELRVVYVSPLRALSNDMHRNLQQPLDEILSLAAERGLDVPEIRVRVRTGDTSASERAAIIRKPPHILVTTPESLYLMLTSVRGRETLKTVDTVIVDEIHALVRDKRGSHLALTLERLSALCPRRIQRIGLSATQRPIETIAEFLSGCDHADTVVVDIGHSRKLDLQIETPHSELGAVCMHEQWAEVHQRIVELIHEHRATLIFVNTRRLAERLTHQLSEILGEDVISSHHGSLAWKHRHDTEQRLRSGQLKAVVATASLEMGIDIGYVDLVIQVGSPRNIATFLQRIGRSGHALGLIPKGRLFALTRDELMECGALIRAVRQGVLDAIPIPIAPVDVLAQQIVAEVASEELSTDDLFTMVRRAWPYRSMSRDTFDRVIRFLSEGLVESGNAGRVFLHHDQVQRRLRARPAARMAAIANGGAIPEIFSVRVITEEDGITVGSVDEDFAVDSMAGDIFLLGNNSWRIRYLRGGDLFVSDAGGAPPSIPFWRGEAPGRTIELSESVSALREELENRVSDRASAVEWLMRETGMKEHAAAQIAEYAAAQKAAIGLLPTCRRVVFERFFDESGGMQLVIHAPFGTRLTRAWGLAMRKRFCRSFDFELQANADDDGIVLSLGPQHSFPLESMFPMLNSRNVQEMFEQAVLVVPIFLNRWRWNATRALQIPRSRNGKKVPPAIQRFRGEDLLTAVFPKLTGCQENVVGDIELPDDPLVRQTMDDCLYEAHDMEALKQLFTAVEQGEIEFIARDTREPSPFSYELLNASPYAFLDGGEAAERRARAVANRRSLSADDVRDLAQLDPEAINQVVRDAQPLVRNPDELHDLLLSRIVISADEGKEWFALFRELLKVGRVTQARYSAASDTTPEPEQRIGWVATERLPAMQAAFPEAVFEPMVSVPDGVRKEWESTNARVAMVRGLLEVSGPVDASVVARRIGIRITQAEAALEALEGEGVVLRGRFTPGLNETGDASAESVSQVCEAPAGSPAPVRLEWCHRRLLSRIHRMTIEGLRRQVQPVSADVFMRFLIQHHGVGHDVLREGSNGLFEVIGMLQGIDIPAVTWERDILPSRVRHYQSQWLDELCLTGEVGWMRLFPPPRTADRSRPMAGITRVAPISIFLRDDMPWLLSHSARAAPEGLSSPATHVLELLTCHGAMFASDLMTETGMLRDHLDDALGELVSRGLVTADGFSGLRSLTAQKSAPSSRRSGRGRADRIRATRQAVGRWSLTPRCSDGIRSDHMTPVSPLSDQTEVHTALPQAAQSDQVQEWAWQLLRRWGIVSRDLLANEDAAPPWFELLQVFRRLEARGEIRGGRFVSGIGGEQFAIADTVQKLRRLRENETAEEIVVLSAADPLNLIGVLWPGHRLPRTASNRLALLNGTPVAILRSDQLDFLQPLSDVIQQKVAALLTQHASADLAVPV